MRNRVFPYLLLNAAAWFTASTASSEVGLLGTRGRGTVHGRLRADYPMP